MLNALGSPLNKSGNLKVYIHTIHNKIFNINSGIRIARNYNRFKGLIANLLIDEEIVDKDKKLISQVEGNLNDLIKTIENSDVLLFSSKGTLIKNIKTSFLKILLEIMLQLLEAFKNTLFQKKSWHCQTKSFQFLNIHSTPGLL